MTSDFVLFNNVTTVDTVLPIHIAWHGEATAKSTTKYGRQQFTHHTAKNWGVKTWFFGGYKTLGDIPLLMPRSGPAL